MSDGTLIAIAALVTAIFSAKPFWDWMGKRGEKNKLEIKSSRERANYILQMQYLLLIAGKMSAIRELDSITRVIIFAGHNGGGVPRASSRYYTTALHWDVEPEYETKLKEYKNVEVDGNYINMLLNSLEGDLHFKTSEMADCRLKIYYQAEEVVESMVFYLDLKDNNFIYMSVASQSPEGISIKDKSDAQLIASSLRSLVQESNS